MRNQIIASNNTKHIILPFNGLYNSYLDAMLDNELENLEHNGISEDDIAAINDLIYGNIDIKRYNLELCQITAEVIEDSLNYDFNTNIQFSSVSYEPLNGQNVGDNLAVKLDVTCLPSIEQIASIMSLSVSEVWNQLQILSNEQFSSYSGFISFYDTDLSDLKTAHYANWEDVYIMLIIQLLCNYASLSPSDIEDKAIESVMQTYCDFVDMALAHIKDDNVINQINKLLVLREY